MAAPVPAQNYIYEAEVIAWIDGDTVALAVTKDYDFGFHITVSGHYEGHFRLLGVDTPERGHLNYRAAGDYARKLAPVGSIVTIETHTYDKYGRYLAKVVTSEGINVANELIKMGLGYPYFGGHKPTAEEQIATFGQVHLKADPVVVGEVATMHASGAIEVSQQ